MTLFTIPLVLHPNKAYLAKHSTRFIFRSRIITSIEMLIIPICAFALKLSFASSLCAGVLVSAVSRISAWLLQKKGA